MLYGIQTGFGSPQVPVAELLARPAPTLLSPQKPKSSNFLQVPDIESPRYVSQSFFMFLTQTKEKVKKEIEKKKCDDGEFIEKAITSNLCGEAKKKIKRINVYRCQMNIIN